MKIIECNLPRNGNFAWRGRTEEVILHHAEASSATVWDINQWHLDNGWTGIGYHYYIRKDGSIYRGRPEWAVGAHATGHNDRSIGVCCEGAYMTETMPAAQLSALRALLRDIMGRYGALALRRHRDVNATNCPGDRFPWAEAQKYMEEDDGMLTYEQFKAYMERWQKEQEGKSPSAWAADTWQAAAEAGITDGTAPGAPMTREMGVTMLGRCGLVGKGEK
ncbi:N-acetylmuramoyl-L-alanine amidase [Intestinibacillus sp. NTUH-41-i26]|uniref:N-acetylmuramoyl-L-alanine amidase n=1 Tax=Intestinibacillus sp. NTUH-41-i26 TaxID=3079303 RepID=UPI0029346A62|nr:N-acetylmuramoyl-L-alanine amidase [Intestinibacillus sp. NTUH-41-i26]WOC74129.1 N-acetylmuramoyl-L-alanine amidase [Intestinibacillus sp. NTUH-41-i26]